jgi:ribosomal protein S18 acetylase RimI-like enzyme
MITVRKATDADADALWQMLHEVAREGDSFPFELDMERDESLARWLSAEKWTYVACQGGEVVGTYALRPNHGGPGSHVANAGYIVRSEHRGKGIGTAMVQHSLDEARRLGFEAMQFNLVVSTNERAIHIYTKLGFMIVGSLPRVFRHPDKGLVDAYVMHRFL